MLATGEIIVIGSSGGIGNAIVTHLSCLGWSVIGVDKVRPNRKQQLQAFHQLNLLNLVEFNTLFRGYAFESLWGVVHCAGVYPIITLDQYTIKLWDKVNHINLKSAFLVAKLLSSRIQTGGRMVFVASAAAFLGSADVGYSASKSGLTGLVRGLAKVLAKRKILVNAVCPGPVTTPMSARMTRSAVRNYQRRIPLRRFAEPKEIAVPVAFLLDPNNTYMTGSSLDVSGGLSMH